MRTDAELLRAYAAGRDESAFAELAERHGPMIFRVGRRVLGNDHDAEEVAQAAFLVLLRRSGAAARTGNPAAWLHGLARNLALQALHERRRRAEVEEESAVPQTTSPEPEAVDEQKQRALELLDRELSGLSAGQRQAVVLRYLEGHSLEAAARIANCPPGTLGRRASDGVKRLRARLAGRGLALSVVALGALLESQVEAAVPASLLPSILAAPKLAAPAGTAGLPAVASAQAGGTGSAALALADGALKAMFRAKLKAAAIVLAAVAAGGATAPLVLNALAGDGQQVAAAPAHAPEPGPVIPPTGPEARPEPSPAPTQVGPADRRRREVEIPLAELPPAVRAAAEAAVEGLVLAEADRVTEGADVVRYEIEGVAGGRRYEVQVAPDGRVLKAGEERPDGDDDGDDEKQGPREKVPPAEVF